MNAVATVMLMYSVLVPGKTWFAPDQPMLVQIKDAPNCTLVMKDFYGKRIEPAGEVSIKAGQDVDLKAVFPQVKQAGAYVVYAVPADGSAEFLGTPLVVTSRGDSRPGAPPGITVSKIEPLCYARMTTDHGDISMLFYYDVAPNTTAHILSLAAGGYFDGLTFHRIVPGFVIQGGDPRGDGSGGPGFNITAEFNDRPHDEGVLSMARQGSPEEQTGAPPRPEFANSAGSQFFICLDASRTKMLDRRYTAFGKVFEGMDAVKKIAATPADPRTGRPQQVQTIKKVQVVPVTAKDNPYRTEKPTTQPVE